MQPLTKLNALLNRAQRVSNEAAVILAAASDQELRHGLEHVVAAIKELLAAQSALHALEPGLAYHYDPTMAPTAYMLQVRALINAAESLKARGDRAQAIDRLKEALALEPPALTYEVISKEIAELEGGGVK